MVTTRGRVLDERMVLGDLFETQSILLHCKDFFTLTPFPEQIIIKLL